MSQRPNNAVEWFETAPVQVKQMSIPLGWSATNIFTAKLVECPAPVLSPSAYDDTLCIVNSGNLDTVIQYDSVRKHHFKGILGRGNILLTPRDLPFDITWEGNRNNSATWVQIPRPVLENQVAGIAKGDPTLVALQIELGLEDPLIEQLVFALQREMEQGGPLSALYSDALAN